MILIPPRKKRDVPVRAMVPNLITTVALCCGLASIHFAIRAAFAEAAGDLRVSPRGIDDWDRALAAVLLSAIFDALDGRAARLLRVTSRFGEVLDSLSDFVSFGVAPALLIYLWLLRNVHPIGLGAVMTFALCSGLRLARFTSQIPATPPAAKANPRLGNYFIGMPTPAAAGAVLVPKMIDASHRVAYTPPPWLVVSLTFLIAFLMISRIPMFSFKKVKIGRVWVPFLLALVGLIIGLLFMETWLTLAGIALLYLLSLPLSILSYRRAVRDAEESPLPPAPAPAA